MRRSRPLPEDSRAACGKPRNFSSDVELSLIYIAKKLKEALQLEEILRLRVSITPWKRTRIAAEYLRVRADRGIFLRCAEHLTRSRDLLDESIQTLRYLRYPPRIHKFSGIQSPS